MESEMGSKSMMQQAQHIWSMLDDMADNDPKAYRRFIEKQKAEQKEYMSPPEPHMCVQTQMTKPEKVPFYINFCVWKRIPPPANSEEPVKVGGSAIGQLKEDKGKAAVTAVAFNEKVLKDYGIEPISTKDQDTLVQIAMDFIERQHSHVRLNRQYKILEKTHKGSIKMIQESLIHAFRTKERGTDDEMAKVLGSFAPMAMESPETLIGQLNTQNDQSESVKQTELASDRLSGITLNPQPVKKGLIEEIDSTTKTLPEPVYEINTTRQDNTTSLTETVIVKISLPGVKSVAECELDISKDDISLVVDDKYELSLSLPQSILEEESSAKFNKKTSWLTLTMPVSSS